MSDLSPRVSIGLPVYNGERYLEDALDSILAQSFTDFELIIADNASTDRTQEICQTYAAKDQRIRYVRNQENIGAVANWYLTFELARGDYFAAAADDDLYDPEFLRKCIAILDQNPAVVMCYTRTKLIDERGHSMGNLELTVDTTSPKPADRLYNVINIDLLCIQLYGLMRASVLAATQKYSGYYGCDWNTLAELCLRGQVYELPEYLFIHRLHPNALGAARGSGLTLRELQLLDPGIDWRTRFPTAIKFRNYFAAVARVPLSISERMMCFMQLARLIAGRVIKYSKRQLNLVRA